MYSQICSSNVQEYIVFLQFIGLMENISLGLSHGVCIVLHCGQN